VIDQYLREGPLVDLPLHPRQHTYQAGKSTESALHQLVSRLERALDQKQYALGVFFDIEGAFDNSSPCSVRYALDEWRVIKPVKNWIVNMIESCSIHVCLENSNIVVQAGRRLPQGGSLSPTVWSLIADSLLKWLSKQGVYAQGFADDGIAVVIGCFLTTLCEIMQRVLKGVEHWCMERELSVNPSKTELMLFTRKYKVDRLSPVIFYGKELTLYKQMNYLGVILDPKLSWKLLVDVKCNKALAAFYQVRTTTSKTWGASPKVVHWIYMAVIRPMLTYAAVIWWPRARYITVSKQLTCYNSYISTTIGVPVYYRSHENNSYSSYETAGRSGSATYTFIQQEAIMAYYRLRAASQWVDGRGEHAKISQKWHN